MKLLKSLKFVLLLIPVLFIFLTILYKDFSYIIFSVISLLIIIVVLFPKIVGTNTFSFTYKPNAKSAKKKSRPAKLNLLSSISSSLHEKKMFFVISLIFFLVLFTYIGSAFLQTTNSVYNVFLEYYVSQIFALKITWIFLIVSLVILTLIGSGVSFNGSDRQLEFEFKKSLLTQKLLSAIGALFIAFFLSFFTIYIYAVVQLNFSVIAIQTTPNAVGVVYGKTQINNKLKSMTSSPQVVSADNNLSNTTLATIISGGANQKSFYQTRILKSIPHSLILPFSINNQPVVLVQNTLIINTIDKDTMQTISPALAHLFLNSFFKNHVWKADPNVIILSRQDYLAFRQSEINDEVKKISDEIQKVEDYIGQVQSDIALSNQKIAANQGALQQAQDYKATTYNNCINAGYYDFYLGGFYHYYTQSYCEGLASQYDQYITGDQQNINDWNSRLQTDEGYLTDAQTVEKEYQTARDYVNSTKDSTPDETGKFNPPNTVRVVLDSTNSKGVDEFIETLVHENLHYQSSIKDRNFQFSDGSYDGFWEEGLTEYFARKVVAADLSVNINQGYPLIVKIVAQITKKIPESTLERIYFDKDDSTLQSVLNNAYGNTFYKDTEPYFEYLSYLPDNLQLKYANNIMTRIGGRQLTSKDLYSTDVQ